MDRGVSYEMTSALFDLASNAGEASISFQWDPIVRLPDSMNLASFSLAQKDAAPLEKAMYKLAASSTPVRTTVVGRVHLLAKKEVGSPGVFGVESIPGMKPSKVRVRLASDDAYHEAV
jgi:hypothetical protein